MGATYLLLMHDSAGRSMVFFFLETLCESQGAPWVPQKETCTKRGLERDCGNTDADGARATRPRNGDGDGPVDGMVDPT